MSVSPAATVDTGWLRRRWTVAFVVGEMVGFLPPALVGAALGATGVDDWVLVGGLTLAGTLEGGAIGLAQSRVLRRAAPLIDRRGWVAATVVAAGFAWLVGMGGGALMGSGAVPAWLAVILLVPAWTAALLAMGYGQWLVMRRTVPSSARWIWVVAGSWLLGVPIPVAALSLTPNGWPPAAFVAIGLTAAVAMGAVVGALTGRTLAQLLSGSTPPSRSSTEHAPSFRPVTAAR
jgi:hypothetical protein